MSKIGNKPINIPDKVAVTINGKSVSVKGPLGVLSLSVASDFINVEQVDSRLLVTRKNNVLRAKAEHGLYNSLIKNMVQGVTELYKVRLSLVGVGYRVQKKAEGLSLTLGYSHPIEVEGVKGIEFVTEGDTNIVVQGIDKQLVGQVAANIRKLRPPEPYKGKGVRYAAEHVRKKAGKAGKK